MCNCESRSDEQSLNTVTSSLSQFNEVSGIIAPYWWSDQRHNSRCYSRPDQLIAQLFHLELRPTTFLPAYPSLFMPELLLFIFICPGFRLINYSQPSTKLLSFFSRSNPPKRTASSLQSTSPPFPSRSSTALLSPRVLSRSAGWSASCWHGNTYQTLHTLRVEKKQKKKRRDPNTSLGSGAQCSRRETAVHRRVCPRVRPMKPCDGVSGAPRGSLSRTDVRAAPRRPLSNVISPPSAWWGQAHFSPVFWRRLTHPSRGERTYW